MPHTMQRGVTQQRGYQQTPFSSLYRHGFVRVAAAVPLVAVADPPVNAERTLALARAASQGGGGARRVSRSSVCSAYTSEDLFRQAALLDATLHALERIVSASVALAR